MTKDFLQTLVCPSCNQRFDIERIVKVNNERFLYGTIRCHCSVFPIVDGILIYKHDEKTKNIINYIVSKKIWKALKLSFDYRPDLNKLLMATDSNASIGYKLLGYIICIITLSRSRINIPLFRLLDLARKLRIQVFWTTYLKHRFSATSFWCTLPLLKLIDVKSKYILDIGCGMGIFSYMMSKRIPEEFIVCQNLEFTGLYLAKKYFVPHANFICSDAGEAQPFAEQTFDVVFSCDALQYVANKDVACKEVARMVNEKGIVILAHNHFPLHRDYALQGFRGDFFDMESAEKVFTKLGLKVKFFDEHQIYNKLFPSVISSDSKEEYK